MNTVQIQVRGMTCGSCVASVTRVLTKLRGVAGVEVDLTTGVAKVTTQHEAADSVPEMIAALATAGYEAAPFRERQGAVPRPGDQPHAQPGCGSGSASGQAGGGCCCR